MAKGYAVLPVPPSQHPTTLYNVMALKLPGCLTSPADCTATPEVREYSLAPPLAHVAFTIGFHSIIANVGIIIMSPPKKA